MLSAGALTVGIGAFVVDATGIRVLDVRSAPRVRAASTLKPLLAWVAAASDAFSGDRARWEALARRAITVSDNAAAAELWSAMGGERVMAILRERVDVGWQVGGDGEHPLLRVMVTATELARAYAYLVTDTTPVAVAIRSWMQDVPVDQTLGLREVASDALPVDACDVGVKCGWFGGERTHAVVYVTTKGRTIGCAVTTSSSPDAATRSAVNDAMGNDGRLIGIHDELAGDKIRDAARRALLAAAEV